MMDRWEVQFDFWSSFGLPAYEQNSVPEDALMPRITYEAAVGGFDEPVSITAQIWDRSADGWAFLDRKADEIESRIRSMGCPLMEGGRYRVYIGNTPFAQNLGDPEDRLIKRKIINVTFEFMKISY